jgi:AcrR family transcriptional regulator
MRENPTRVEAIVEAALDLAEERGIGGITTASLANKLEFTEAALYRYFPGKDAIIAAAMRHLADRLFATMLLELAPSNASGHDPAHQLERHIVRFTYRSGLLLELLMHGAGGRDSHLQQSGHSFLEQYSARIDEYFESLTTAGLLASSSSTQELTRLWICQLLGGFVRVRLMGETWDPTTQPGFQSFIAHLRRGLPSA